MRALIEACRPRQWVKNAIVAAPLVFAKQLTDPHTALRALAAVGLFCCLSSAVYLWNDIVDVERDREHPIKRNRPIASGRLPIGTARIASATLASGALATSLVIDWRFAACALAYLAKDVAYSLWLKRIVYVDVLAIAAGFLLRVAAGAFAIGVDASPYLLLCTALAACYFGFGKRAHELGTSGERAVKQRPVLQEYRVGVLRWCLYITGAASLISYFLYTRAEHTVRFFGTTNMVYTVVFAAFGLWRFYRLVQAPRGDSPTDEMLKDAPFMVNVVMWIGAICFIIYYFHPTAR